MIVFLVGLLIGFAGGAVLAILLVRDLGKAARKSTLADGLFRKLTGFETRSPKSETVSPAVTPADKPQVDNLTLVRAALTGDMGFSRTEAAAAISHINSVCPSDSVENKIFQALCFLGRGAA